MGHPGAAEHRHVDIEQDHVGERGGPKDLEPLFSSPRRVNVMSFRFKHVGDALREIKIVIDDEYVGQSLPPGRAPTPRVVLTPSRRARRSGGAGGFGPLPRGSAFLGYLASSSGDRRGDGKS
jgi:hypothetical protein